MFTAYNYVNFLSLQIVCLELRSDSLKLCFYYALEYKEAKLRRINFKMKFTLRSTILSVSLALTAIASPLSLVFISFILTMCKLTRFY